MTRFAAAFEAEPSAQPVPPFASVEARIVPALIVVTPEYVFAPESVSVPDPTFVREPGNAVLLSTIIPAMVSVPFKAPT